MRIPLSAPDISETEIDAVVAVLRGSQLSLGPKMEEFEEAVADYVGVRHGIAVSSGTAGAAPRNACVRDWRRRRSDCAFVYFHRGGKCCALCRCDSGLCGHRRSHVEYERGCGRERDHTAHSGDYGGSTPSGGQPKWID